MRKLCILLFLLIICVFAKSQTTFRDGIINYEFGTYDLDSNLCYQYKDSLKVTFLLENETFQIKIENLTNSPLYINLALSSFSRNGNQTRYISKVKDISVNLIPPKSYYLLTEIKSDLGIDTLNREMGLSLFDELYKTTQKQKEYIESTSPVIYRNILAFTPDKNLENNITILDNKFWIKKLFIYKDAFGSYTDSRDGRTYKTIKIGTQTWMAENLNADHYRNGDVITEAKSDGEWIKDDWIKYTEKEKGCWCYFDHNSTNGKFYGKLYNKFAIYDERNISPNGWHIPSDKEWATLIDYLGGTNCVATSLKSTKGWDAFWGNKSSATNSSGFSAVRSGTRDQCCFDNGSHKNDNGTISFLFGCGYWSSTKSAYVIYHDTRDDCLDPEGYGGIRKWTVRFKDGYSVRCVKDE